MSAAAIDPQDARETAHRILDGRRFKGAPVPRPLHGVLRWIGDRVSPITHWIGDRFSWLPDWSRPWALALGILVAVAAVTFAVVAAMNAYGRNRAARLDRDAELGRVSRGEDARELEAAADTAEARGDLALAVRLRFRAGLLRLDRDAHAISYRPSLPTGEVRAELAIPEFDALADRFEDITYGGEPAAPDDTDGARRDWPRVVASARKP